MSVGSSLETATDSRQTTGNKFDHVPKVIPREAEEDRARDREIVSTYIGVLANGFNDRLVKVT